MGYQGDGTQIGKYCPFRNSDCIDECAWYSSVYDCCYIRFLGNLRDMNPENSKESLEKRGVRFEE